ncbi:MAG: hypothetical protein CBE47_02865 [Pelagibacteraceae bacterium TMED287]|jgi:mannosyltransferase OCH1-like enzyme|nr:MAG: hypothetical protein CBE47_02865 [Pelagibacteraceae bacterium TMED287]|tara:strand:- start:860 stop:1525 length:666 start_codon:yes stop_codon:yes gene_type:complete
MIPKIIHQMGPDKEINWPYIWVEGHKLMKQTFPEFEHKLWRNSEVFPFVEKHYPQYLKLMHKLPSITKLDFFRNVLMYHFGGLYFDLDFLVYKNFYNILKHDKPTIIEGMYKHTLNEKVQNNFFASPAKHKTWLRVMDEVGINFETIDRSDTWYNKVMKISSSLFFTNYVNKFPDDFNILPRDPFNLTQEECAKLKESDIPCRHLGTGVWLDERNDTLRRT